MRVSKVLPLVCLLALGLSWPAVAQAPPSDYLYVFTTTVKPGNAAEYEDYVKKIVAGANKIGAPQTWISFQVSLGGPGYTYFVGLPFNQWGDMDAWPSPGEIVLKAHGDVEGNKILKSGRAAVESSETAVYRLLSNLSTKPKAFDPATTANVLFIRTEVEPELASAYELYLSKVKAVQDQAPGAPTAIRRVSVQGPSNVYVSAQLFNKNAERDAWPNAGELLRKAYGEAEAQHLAQTSARCIRKRDIWTLTYRADLSRPTPTKAPTDN